MESSDEDVHMKEVSPAKRPREESKDDVPSSEGAPVGPKGYREDENEMLVDINDYKNGGEMAVEEIDVEFDVRVMEEVDYKALTRFLSSLCHKQSFNNAEMADLLLGQEYLGSVIREEGADEAFGFISAVPMFSHKEKECIRQIKRYVLTHAPDSKKAFWKEMLESPKLGLLLNERLLNVPQGLVPELHTTVYEEIAWKVEDKQPFSFDHMLYMTSYGHPDRGAAKGKQPSKRLKTEEKKEFFKPEDVVYLKYSRESFEVAKTHSETIIVVLFPMKKVPEILQEVQQVITEGYSCTRNEPISPVVDPFFELCSLERRVSNVSQPERQAEFIRTDKSILSATLSRRPSRHCCLFRLSFGPSTSSVHALLGHDTVPVAVPAPINVPIYPSSTYRFRNAGHAARACAEEEVRAEESNFLYIRWANPTCRAVAQHIARIEGGFDAHMTGSGMAAISTALMTLLSAGDHVVIPHAVYGGTHDFCLEILINFGIEITWIDEPSIDTFAAAIRPNTKVLYAETPSNPNLRCVDLLGLATLARAKGLVTLVDSTFASPLMQQPIAFDVQEYIGGHSDLLAGVITSRTRELWEKMNKSVRLFGGVLSPHDAFLVERGLKTLALRMAAHNSNALKVAQYLEDHSKVERVLYPGLASHPDHELAMKQMTGCGGVVAFVVKGGVEAGKKVIETVKLITLAVSLGGVESLITHPASTTHVHVPSEQRRRAGIDDGLIRLSVGVEDVVDIIADLEQALECI